MSPRRTTWIGVLEMLAVFIVVAAILALAVWFLFFAHNPLLRP
jgi:hypothetical protein